MSKLPAFQFYPGDWMKDPNLRRCSKGAKGVWIDAMCLMFECEDRGVFASGGKPWTREEIAGAIGGDLAENLACIEELLLKGVAVLTKLGAISNKRMVRDEKHRADNRSYQSKHRKFNKTNENSKTNVRPMSDHSSTSSSSSKQIPKTTPKEKPSAFMVPLWIPPDIWEAFEEMRKKIRAPLTDRARSGIVSELERLGKDGHDPETVMLQTITRSYRGVFPISKDSKKDESPMSKMKFANGGAK